MILQESLEKYYDLPVLRVITQFPVEFGRMFIAAFEKKVFVIDLDSKKRFLDKIKDSVRDKRNIFLDTFNRITYGFNSTTFTPSSTRYHPDYEVEISFNIYGSHLKYDIKSYIDDSRRGSVYPKTMMDLYDLSCKAFFKKFFSSFDEISSNSGSELKHNLGSGLEKFLKTHYMDFRSSEEDHLRPNESKITLTPNFEAIIGTNRSLARLIREVFLYSFLKTEYFKIEKSIVSYLNRRNLWISRIEISDSHIEYTCTFTEDENKIVWGDHSYKKLQSAHLVETEKQYNEMLSKNPIYFQIESVKDFRKHVVKKILKEES